MTHSEVLAADVLDEIEAAIAAGRSMGLGAWAILNRVRHLTRPVNMAELQQEIATATPAMKEMLAEAFLYAAPACDVCTRTDTHFHCSECGATDHTASSCDMGG